MKKINGFTCGMGIGGWLTNYKRFNVLPDKWRWTLTIGDFEHFESYITENDVKNIAKMGFDHVRVGFDQVVLEKEPFSYREEIFKLLENFVSWCRKYGLNIVFNLHKAVGNYCDIDLTETLLESDPLQERFIALWEKIEERFHADTGIAFELLNEVVDVDPEVWNNLVEKTVKRLRALNPTRLLVVGGTSWNSVNKLDKMRVYDDENIIYTFHTYAPFEFTHQRGVLQAAPLYYNRKTYYPGDIEPYRDYQRVVYGAKNPYAEFEKMKPSCMLINTARGPIVKEEALIDALTTGKIATAGLDTYEREPMPKDHPLLTLDNVVASAHAGGNTKDNDINMITYVYDNIVAFDEGRPLRSDKDIVNAQYLK